jgi:hypothetical protein
MLFQFYFIIALVMVFCLLLKWYRPPKVKTTHPQKKASHLYQAPKLHLSPNINYKAYAPIDHLFTPCEKNFYNALSEVLPPDLLIFGKVRVADVLQPKAKFSGHERYRIFGKICAKHLDYVICDAKTLSIQCCIELHDRSHQQTERMERDLFLREIFKEAGIRLVEITAQKKYDKTWLKKDLSFLFRKKRL